MHVNLYMDVIKTLQIISIVFFIFVFVFLKQAINIQSRQQLAEP